MAAQWIPNIDSFFDSLVRVIWGARTHLSTDQVNSAEFWCRTLDEYERTLRLLLARVELASRAATFGEVDVSNHEPNKKAVNWTMTLHYICLLYLSQKLNLTITYISHILNWWCHFCICPALQNQIGYLRCI